MAVIRDIIPAFELFQPATIDDAVRLADKYRDDYWVLAGGLDSMAQKRNLWILSDEAYEDVVFEGEHVSIASLPGMLVGDADGRVLGRSQRMEPQLRDTKQSFSLPAFPVRRMMSDVYIHGLM